MRKKEMERMVDELIEELTEANFERLELKGKNDVLRQEIETISKQNGILDKHNNGLRQEIKIYRDKSMIFEQKWEKGQKTIERLSKKCKKEYYEKQKLIEMIKIFGLQQGFDLSFNVNESFEIYITKGCGFDTIEEAKAHIKQLRKNLMGE